MAPRGAFSAARTSGRRGARRRLLRGVAALLGLLFGFALLFPPLYVAAGPDAPADAPALPTPDPRGTYTVYVTNWDYHTSVTIPQPPAWHLGPPGSETAPYLDYSWGDRAYFRDSEYRSFYTLFALPSTSALHLVGRDRPPTPREARAVYRRVVDAHTLARLAAELEGAVVHTPTGERIAPAPAIPGYAGRFYDARGDYLWARDCNRWTVDRLRAAGLAGSGAGVVFAAQVPGRLVGFAPVPER